MATSILGHMLNILMEPCGMEKYNIRVSTERFKSFIPLLTACCQAVSPQVIVEYGPGESTQCLLDNTTGVIYSWENQSSYYGQAVTRFAGNSRVKLFLGDTKAGPGKKTPYVNAPYIILGAQSADLVFVDGRYRADCMACASMLVKDTGVVVLHDDERPSYDPGRSLFPFYFRSAETITGCYSKTAGMIARVAKVFQQLFTGEQG